MKFCALLIAISLALTTKASFELVLVADDTNKVVHRYDGGTGISLGSFGGGGFLSAARGVVVDQPNNTALVLEGTSCAKFNYNTGEFLGNAFSLAFNATEMARLQDGTLLAWNGTTCARLSSAGVAMNSYVPPAGRTIKEGTLGPDGRIYLTTVDGSGVSHINWYNVGGSNAIGSSSWLNDGMTADSAYMITGTGGFFERWIPIAGGGPQSSYVPVSAGGVAVTGSACIGHAGMAYFGVSASGVAKIGRFDYQGLRSRGSFGTFGSVNGIAVVVAPEPGTLTSLAFAGVLLLKRRRKSR